MEQKGMYTVGRTRTEILDNIHMFLLQSTDASAYIHLQIENDQYYDTLEDDSEAKQQLKKEWDLLSAKKQSLLKDWEKKYASADNMDRHDLAEQRRHILFSYEKERSIRVRHNYHFYRTYWDL